MVFQRRGSHHAPSWLVFFLLTIAAAAVWLYAEAVTPTAAPTAVTGQATSSSGSTMVGASPSTQPNQTSGQAVSPSGSTTTGSLKQ